MELFDALLPINLLAMAYLLLFTAGRWSDWLQTSSASTWRASSSKP